MLRRRADGLPSGWGTNSSTGLVSGTVSSGDAENGPYAVTVTASDGTYSSSATFNWNVTHTDTTALTMTNPGTQVNVTGDSVNLQINASDPDGLDSLYYTATGLPDGLDIDPFAGTISGTVADDAASPTPYQVTVTADDGNGQTVSQTFSMLVNPSPIIVQALPINALEGEDTGSITVANFTTADLFSQASDYTAVIYWGDGSSDMGSVSGSNGNFTVSEDHTYAEKGTYPVTVQIFDTVTGGIAAAASTATVADAPLSMTGGFQYGDSYTDAQSGYVVATFTDGNPNAPLSDYTLSVNWGDGIITNGAAASYISSAGDGLYQIVVPHNYANPYPAPGPTYTVTVTLTDVDGASAQVTDTVVVGDIVSDVPATMGTWAFVDQNTLASASDFVAEGQTGKALINWGDGTSSLGTVSGSSGYFNIVAQSPHTYAQDSYEQPNGVYTITVTVTDEDSNVLTGQQYVRVVRPPVALYVNDVETPVNSLTLTNAQVAAFTVPDGVDAASEFSASINWGDNTTSNGTIQEVTPGLYQVLGSHTYATGGEYAITVTVDQGWQVQQPAARRGEIPYVWAKINLTGPSVVPGNSNYDYSFRLPNEAKNITLIATPISPVNAPVPQVQAIKGKPPGWFTVGFWNVPATYLVQLRGQYTLGGTTYRTSPLNVWVVGVTVEDVPTSEFPEPDTIFGHLRDPNTKIAFSSNPGPQIAGPAWASGVIINNKKVDVQLLGISTANKPGSITAIAPLRTLPVPFNPISPPQPQGAVTFGADVVLGSEEGPLNEDQSEAIGHITVGFMQHVNITSLKVYIGDNITLTGAKYTNTQGQGKPVTGWILDAEEKRNPWFSTHEFNDFTGEALPEKLIEDVLDGESTKDEDAEYDESYSGMIMVGDSPVVSFPYFLPGKAGTVVTKIDIQYAFQTDVVAMTDKVPGHYSQETSAKWIVNLIGDLKEKKEGGYEFVLTQGPGVIVIPNPNSWIPLNDPMTSQENTSGPLVNNLTTAWKEA